VADKVASFAINLEGNAKDAAKEDAAALEALRDKIDGSQKAIKEYGTALRLLKGKTDDVAKAKEQLKGRLDAERQKMSANALAVLKLGGSFTRLKTATRETSKDTEKLKKDMGGLAEGFAIGGIIGGIVAALSVFTAGVGAASSSLTRFIVESADALRNMALFREAAAGSAQNAYNLGTQVDALARKVPASKVALNEMATALTRSLSGTRVSGQGIVDTFNLVAQASDAMGAEVGNQLGEIVKRSKQFGRLGINPFELQGTGVQFTDIAEALAKRLHVSVGKAAEELRFGMVEVNAGAAAIRDVVEKRFGEINARKLLSLDVQAAKFKERLQGLASGVNLEPLLKMIDRISSLFDVTTVSGDALQTAITKIGEALFGSFTSAGPLLEQLVKKLIIVALKITIIFLKARKMVAEAFKVPRNVEILKVALATIAAAGLSIIAVFSLVGIAVGGAIAFALAPILALGAALVALWKGGQALYNKFTSIDWSGLGKAIIQGIKNGLLSAWGALKSAVSGIGEKIKSTFTDVLGIQSPSKVFAGYGEQIGAGTAKGIDASAPSVQASAADLAPASPTVPAPRAASSPTVPAPRAASSPLSITVNVNMGGTPGGASQPAQQVADIKAAVTQAIKLALRQAGTPVAA
jgi:hypothetical protein